VKEIVEAKVRIDPENIEEPLVIVRKTLIREDGIVEKKYGLSKYGIWIEVPKATMYPEECYLPVAIYRIGKEVNLEMPNL